MAQTINAFKNLTEPQSVLLATLEQDREFTDFFFLTGGTLLKALDISPRHSDDLDFFTFATVDRREVNGRLLHLKNLVERIFGSSSITLTDRGFLHLPSGTLIDVVADAIKNIDVFQRFGNLAAASLKDLAAHKASALCSRDEVKDYIDLAFLTKHQGWNLNDLANFAEQKFGIATVTEEKLLAELLAQRDTIMIPDAIFLRNPQEQKNIIARQIDHLIEHTTV